MCVMEHCLFNTPHTHNTTQVCDDEMMLQCNHLHHLLSSMVLPAVTLLQQTHIYRQVVHSSLFTHTKRCSLSLIQYTKASTHLSLATGNLLTRNRRFSAQQTASIYTLLILLALHTKEIPSFYMYAAIQMWLCSRTNNIIHHNS